MKLLKTVITLFLGLVLVSCSDEVEQAGKISLTARGVLNATGAKNTTNARAISNQQVVIDQFLVNISNIELELDIEEQDSEDENWDNNGYYDHEDDIELQGPFILDLVSGDVNFLNFEAPNTSFEEIEFDINEEANSELFNKSILVKGSINDMPFMFWHDFNEEIEIDFENEQTDIVVNNDLNSLIINFNLISLFADEDLSNISDLNSDGIIEISPSDIDGNNELAGRLKEKIKSLIDLIEE